MKSERTYTNSGTDIFREFKIPRRSDFYALTPMGVGTPFVESLTGYITRLAKCHSLSTGVLFVQAIIPLVDKPYLFAEGGRPDRNALNTKLGACIQALNGLNNTTEDWVNALQGLTLRYDLRFLTLLPWKDLLTNQGLLRKTRAWCRYCYEEQRQKKSEEIYEHLLWTMEIVKVCPKHLCRLEGNCPHCKRQSSLLHNKSLPGHCYRCQGWLGSDNPYRASNDLLEEELLKEINVANLVGELLAVAPIFSDHNLQLKLAKAFNDYVNLVARGNSTEFARLVNVWPSTIHHLRFGNTLVRLDVLVRVCQLFKISLPAFLSGEIAQVTLNSVQLKKPLDKVSVKEFLQLALKNPSCPSVTELTQLLGYKCTSSLYRQYSDLCKAIAAKHKQNRGRRIQSIRRNMMSVQREIEKAIKETPTPPLMEVARRLGYQSKGASYLRRRFPDLCRILDKLYADRLRSEAQRIENALQAATLENPPPTIATVHRRLGYKSRNVLARRFPSLCSTIVRRYAEFSRSPLIKIKTMLEAIANETPPPSLLKASKRVGRCPVTLYLWYPELCRTISARFLDWRKKRAEMRRKAEYIAIRKAATDLHIKGQYPSDRAVAPFVSKKRIRGNAATMLRKIQMELGYTLK